MAALVSAVELALTGFLARRSMNAPLNLATSGKGPFLHLGSWAPWLLGPLDSRNQRHPPLKRAKRNFSPQSASPRRTLPFAIRRGRMHYWKHCQRLSGIGFPDG